MNNKRNHTRQLAFAGLFAAILAVLSVIQIPMPSGVPVTLQTFAVALCGCVLGRKWGFTATLLYVLIGTVGLPVFSGMKGGIGVLAGPTGGFLFGFLALAPLCGLGMEL
ncbi:MAG: biotin transporter BioY, partial [Blautia sp.]